MRRVELHQIAYATVWIRVRVAGGLRPTTSHSIFYGRVGPIVIFSHFRVEVRVRVRVRKM